MSEPIVVPAGGGEVIGDSPDRRVEILSERDGLHVTWSRFGPHRDGADPHVHRLHADLFYVLDGELTVRLGPQDQQVPLAAGTLARVPPLIVHGFRNASDADVRYLNFHAPGTGFADYMRGLRDKRPTAFDQHDPPPDGGRPPAEVQIGAATVLDEATPAPETAEVAIAEVRGVPGGSAAPHVHAGHDESVYVIEGELVLAAGGHEHRLAGGDWATLPAGTPHSVSREGAARYLEVHAPVT
jgi:quercetin dioxygenase-like cupin family protein